MRVAGEKHRCVYLFAIIDLRFEKDQKNGKILSFVIPRSEATWESVTGKS